MPTSNFPNGFSNGVNIRGVPVLNNYGGNVFWVDSGAGSNGNRGSFDRPFGTIDYAIGRCTASNGDLIIVKPGHAETLATASAITADVAGVSIIGLGSGADRPTLTFSATDATMVISAASVTVQNIITKPSIDSVVSPIVVSGADCWLDIEHQDASAAVEAVAAILTTAGADRLHVDLKYRGFIAGNACVNAIRLVGVDTGDINVDFYGVASTAIVEFHTTACHNITVTGEFYNSGTTNLTKDVVDTVTGSTWVASGFDGAAGQSFSGGSGAALAGDDVGAVAAAIAVIDAFHDVPTADAATNSQMRDVVGNKTDAAATGAVSAVESLMAYSKQVVTELQVVDGYFDVPTADAVTDTTIRDVVGRKTDAGVQTAGTTKSVLAYAKGAVDMLGGTAGVASYPAAAAPANGVSIAEVLREAYDQSDKAVTNTTAALVNGTTVFTIAGGPIEILSLVARCVTTNDATASTLQWSADPTDGIAVTISAASASLANVAAGGMVICQGTTLATAPIVNASGAGLGQQVTNGIVVGAGIITTVIGTGSTTGTWQHHLRYRPLARGVTVS